MRAFLLIAGLLLLLPACATRGDMHRVEDALLTMRADQTRLLEEVRSAPVPEFDFDEDVILRILDEMRSELAAQRRQLSSLEDVTSEVLEAMESMEFPAPPERQIIYDSIPADAGGEADQRTRITDLDTSSEESEAPCPDVNDKDAILQAVSELVRRRDPITSAAREGALEYLRCFPDAQQRAKAHLYLAETYALDDQMDEALEEFNRVIDSHPDSPEAPTALYRMADIHLDRGSRNHAIRLMDHLVTRYPRSEEAHMVEEELRRLQP